MSPLPNRLLLALALLTATAAALVARSGLADAHGNPEITVTPNPAAAGSTITIEGKEFEEDEEVSLVLEGISGEVSLGMAITDAQGNFHTEVTLPDSVGPGSYRARAQGTDATALTDLRITPTAGGPQPAAEHETSIGFHREGPASEVIAFSALLAVFAILGFALLIWRERPTA